MRSIALNTASTGPSPPTSATTSASPTFITTRACRLRAGLRRDAQRGELVVLVRGHDALFGDERVQVFVEHLALLVGELLEACERRVDRIVIGKIDAELERAAT